MYRIEIAEKRKERDVVKWLQEAEIYQIGRASCRERV